MHAFETNLLMSKPNNTMFSYIILAIYGTIGILKVKLYKEYEYMSLSK